MSSGWDVPTPFEVDESWDCKRLNKITFTPRQLSVYSQPVLLRTNTTLFSTSGLIKYGFIQTVSVKCCYWTSCWEGACKIGWKQGYIILGGLIRTNNSPEKSFYHELCIGCTLHVTHQATHVKSVCVHASGADPDILKWGEGEVTMVTIALTWRNYSLAEPETCMMYTTIQICAYTYVY